MTSQLSYAAVLPRSLKQALGENWWLFLLRGVAAILFGVLSLALPGITLVTLVLLYGAYALADGLMALVAGLTGKTNIAPRWWLVVVGLLGIGAGIVTFLWPGITALILLWFIAGAAISTGIFQIVGAIQLRKEIDDEWWLILNGLLSVVFGAILFIMPGAGALSLIWIIGLYAIIFGIGMVSFALRVRKYRPGA